MRTFLSSVRGASALVPVVAAIFWLQGGCHRSTPAVEEAQGARANQLLDPTTIDKYVSRLVIPPAMPKAPTQPAGIDYYEIAVRQFEQQILPPGFPRTTVWSYGAVNAPSTFNYPAFTIEATVGTPVRVKWINDLKDPKSGQFLPHLLPVDQTLHWANPPRQCADTSTRTDCSGFIPGPYQGPVPIVTHLHGSHAAQESDGFAEAWFLPAAVNIPKSYGAVGSWYQFFRTEFSNKFGVGWEPGTATFQYENDQRASTLWYHDHSLGMTRLNVYAGPAGFYLLRGGPDDLPAGVLPGAAYEIPIAVQDRSFYRDGSLFYAPNRTFFDGFRGPFIPASDVPRLWNPEFFANTIVVNGRTWPTLDVEQRRYRFRFLNGCNSRFLILKLALDNTPGDGSIDDGNYTALPVPFWQIGSEGGFLPAPVKLDRLLMALAERADVIVDFDAIAQSLGLEKGDAIYLVNEGPDEPFGFEPVLPADAATTRQVMKFVLGDPPSADPSMPPDRLTLPALTPLGEPTFTRRVSLNEAASTVPGFDGPVAALLGTMDGDSPVPMFWHDPITEHPDAGATEVWEIYNFTEDAHPIHIHEVQFQVVNRQPFEGDPRAPEIWESGFKDTVIAYPGEITRVKATFDLEGLYVWHCHIVEHEDNEMMRPYCVGTCPMQ